MNHDILKIIIKDQRETIRETAIFDRGIVLEKQANYVFTGVRRSGKSTMLYKVAKDLVAGGVSWDQIICINFEDERLIGFNVADLNDLTLVANELCGPKEPYYFLDEIQNIDGWEKFARRLADAHKRVYITGSNSKMLSREIETTLGGRFLSKTIYPYSYREYLRAFDVSGDEFSTASIAKRNGLLKEYMTFGGFPESLHFQNKKDYLSSIYQKILLGDIVDRHELRNSNLLRVMLRKIAETIGNPISYSRLYNIIKSVGFSISKTTVISYCDYCEEAYLLLKNENYYASLHDKESNPRFYFVDNGLLSLLLTDKDPLLLENLVAITLKKAYGNDLYYLKSETTGINVDFFLPESRMAIQTCYSLSDHNVYERETKNLQRLRKAEKESIREIIITYEEEKLPFDHDPKIEVIPLMKFLLEFTA